MILRFFKILGPIFILSTVFLSSPAGAVDNYPNSGCADRLSSHNKVDLPSEAFTRLEQQFPNRSYIATFWTYSAAYSGWDLYVAPADTYNRIALAENGVHVIFYAPGAIVWNWNGTDWVMYSTGVGHATSNIPYTSPQLYGGAGSGIETDYSGCFGYGSNVDTTSIYNNRTSSWLEVQYNFNNIGSSTSILAPNFQYTISNKNIKATDLNQELPVIEVESGYYSNGYQVEWSLFKCTSYSNSTCIDSKLVNYQLLLQSQGYEYTTESYGDYELTAQYLVQQCYRYASYPATPDYCFMVDLGQVLESTHIVSPVTKHFILAFMVTSTGDTSEESCYIDGTCVLPSELPCATDLPFFEKSNCIIGKQLKVGILNPTITALADMLKKVQVPADPTCGFNIPVATITDNNSIDLSGVITKACATSEDILESISIIMVVSNFGLSILLFNLTRRLVNKITSPDDHDIITGMEV